MKMIIRFFKDVYNAITDHNRDLSERVFLTFSIISELTVLIAFIADIATVMT